MIDKLFVPILSILVTIQIVLIILASCNIISWIYTLLPLIIIVIFPIIIFSIVGLIFLFCVWRNVR